MSDKFIKDKINLDVNDISTFWESNYKNCDSILQGNLQKDVALAKMRNGNEYQKIFSKYLHSDSMVLDIGCGVGRIAEFCKSIPCYYGLDISSNAIKYARNEFSLNKNISFDVCQVDKELDDTLKLQKQKFNFIIFGGFFAYINDNDIADIINIAKNYLMKNGLIYFREPVSIQDTRLTLKNHYSEELNKQYHAIYRTTEEYNSIYSSTLGNDFDMIEANLMLKDNCQNRKETSQYYWIFKKR